MDTAETTLEIYITNEKKTIFYSDTPEVILKDFYTGEIVKRFKRTVDKSGNPELIKDIPPGRYNIILKWKGEDSFLDNFRIDAKMRNLIYERVN